MGVEGWGLPNPDRRHAMYVGEARRVYEVAGNPTDTPKTEFMLLAEPYGSGACAPISL